MVKEIFEYGENQAPISYYTDCGICGETIFKDSLVQTRERFDFQGAFDRNAKSIVSSANKHMKGKHKDELSILLAQAHGEGIEVKLVMWEVVHNPENFKPLSYNSSSFALPMFH